MSEPPPPSLVDAVRVATRDLEARGEPVTVDAVYATAHVPPLAQLGEILRWTVAMVLEWEREAEGGREADAGGDERSALAPMMESIRALGSRVRKDGAWPLGRFAEALGVKPNNRSLNRALRTLIINGEWDAEGSTDSRVYRPAK